MGKQIVGYVISHTGKPGGPWEAIQGPDGTPTLDPRDRLVVARDYQLERISARRPDAKVFRLVRRERHIAEEAAVVEAAMAWEAADAALCKNRNEAQEDNLATIECSTRYKALQTCAALRAKRGG